MDKIQEYLKNPVYTAAGAFILGLIIGLVVLGWGLFPVQWTDASPAHLREDYQQDYLRMAVRSYAENQDAQLALMRWQALGDDAPDVLADLQQDPGVNPENLNAYSALVGAELPAPGEAGEQPSMTEAPGAVPGEQADEGVNPLVLLGVFCVLTLIIGGALVYVLLIRKRRGEAGFTPVREAQVYNRQVEHTDYAAEGQEPPIAQFMTTYMIGDDLYDDSFSIDSHTGEFLGECGVGISETIGVGDPKKVTAFEVWLFDKNDIQTITKVLMSEHAHNDPNIRQRLMSKGEPVLIEPGSQVLLETATLQLEARIVDMNYGQGALPANSFFERVTLELAVWPKE